MFTKNILENIIYKELQFRTILFLYNLKSLLLRREQVQTSKSLSSNNFVVNTL